MKKRLFSLLFALFLVVAVVAPLSVSAQQGWEDTNFKEFTINVYGFDSYLGTRDKTNTSSVYMYIIDSTNRTVATCVRIDAVERLVGGDVQINTDLTLSNGKYAYYVNCSAGEKYNIHTMIYEKGYRECRPAFKSGAERYATIRGRWSPDCLGTYIDATGLER